MSKPFVQQMTFKVSTSTSDTSIETNSNLSAPQQHQNDRSRSIGPIAFKNWVNLEDNWNLSLNDSDETFDSFGLTIEPDLRIHHPLLALLLGIICLLVIFGNILIMVAIRRERYLHTVTNLFVASLAVADCLVGAIVMPSSVVHEVMNKWWIFGQDWCDLWHSFDVLASTASILNLCVISLDRYWAITDPISYPARMTTRKAKGLRIHRGGDGSDGNRNSDSNSGLVNCVCQNENHQSHYRSSHLKSRQTGEVSFDDSSEMTDDSSLNVKVSSGPHRNVKTFSLSRKLVKLAKEKKAAKTLGIVMGVFILCWLPFFITNLIKGFCGDVCLINPDLVYPLVTWLGWLNSGMNPFIYACWSRDFRRAFRKILCLCYDPESYKTKISQKSIGIIPSNANDDNSNVKRVNNDNNNNDENRVEASLSIIKIIRSRKFKLTE